MFKQEVKFSLRLKRQLGFLCLKTIFYNVIDSAPFCTCHTFSKRNDLLCLFLCYHASPFYQIKFVIHYSQKRMVCHMVYDFEKITLSMKEKYKLFVTRMRKKSKAEYFGDSEYYLSDIKFIRQNSSGKTDIIGSSIPDGTYSVTSNYLRYLTYRREKIFSRVLTSVITPIVVSIVTSILTVIILSKLGLK